MLDFFLEPEDAFIDNSWSEFVYTMNRDSTSSIESIDPTLTKLLRRRFERARGRMSLPRTRKAVQQTFILWFLLFRARQISIASGCRGIESRRWPDPTLWPCHHLPSVLAAVDDPKLDLAPLFQFFLDTNSLWRRAWGMPLIGAKPTGYLALDAAEYDRGWNALAAEKMNGAPVQGGPALPQSKLSVNDIMVGLEIRDAANAAHEELRTELSRLDIADICGYCGRLKVNGCGKEYCSTTCRESQKKSRSRARNGSSSAGPILLLRDD